MDFKGLAEKSNFFCRVSLFFLTNQLGCHFSRDDFWGFFAFLINRLPPTCNEFGGAILFFDVCISASLLAFECTISCLISL